MQWLQDPNQSNVDNLNNVKHKTSRNFTKKTKVNLKAKIDTLEINSNMKNIRDLQRGIDGFKKGYHSGINIVKDEKGDFCYRLPQYYD
jgi:hypothetical protein